MSSVYKALASNSKDKENDQPKETFRNKQRVLVTSSRGVTFRHRHLISDLTNMMPHARKEAKLGNKKNLSELNEIAELYNCNNIIYFEARKHQDLYLWMSKAPNGPTAKFHIQNIHTMDELNFNGNCLKGSRPVLSFDSTFDETAHNKLIKQMIMQSFGVPPKARKSKPFIDHVLTVSTVDNKIWFRNYQISETAEKYSTASSESEISLVEIGPRLVMTLITILEGSFGGAKIYENKQYVSPNFVRAQQRQSAAEHAKKRADEALQRRIKKRDTVLEHDPLSQQALFKGQ